MRGKRFGAALGLAAMLAGCGGGDSGGGTTAATSTATTPTPAPTTAANACSLRARQDWALAQLREWYLFPDTLPSSLDPTPYASVDAYVDALTATARAQHKDRYFTYLTTISGEDAYYDSGSSAGFGFRLGLDPSSRLFITETFEGTAALTAGIDRGAEILAIGTSASNLRTIGAIVSGGGDAALTDALGPDTAGTARVLQVRDATGTRTVTVTKTAFSLTPVSSRYGAQVITDNGQKFGYVNLRTFINTAEPALRQAFASFKAAGVTNVIVDLRYNGGGLINVAETLADLMGGNRAPSDIVDRVAFRPEKASQNTTTNFAVQPESVSPTRLAFIGTGGTASASEIVINAFVPYLHANAALVGTNTYGKPVGQIALDRSQCDDRLRVIALAVQNAAGTGDYYDGLATKVEASCQANDDIGHPLGSPLESSIRAALDFLEGKSCTRIGATASTASPGAAGMSGQAATPTFAASDIRPGRTG
jgi:carboxyl-terminal processing protease